MSRTRIVSLPGPPNGDLVNLVNFTTLTEPRVFSGSPGTFLASFINTNPGIMLVNEISGLKTCILLMRFARRSHNDRLEYRTSLNKPWGQCYFRHFIDFHQLSRAFGRSGAITMMLEAILSIRTLENHRLVIFQCSEHVSDATGGPQTRTTSPRSSWKPET